MSIVILVSVFCLLLTYLESEKKLAYGMFLGFCGITILYSLHYDFGTDYMTYYNNYLRTAAANYSINDVFVLDNWRNGEYGWGLLQWICSKIDKRNGFFLLVIINSLIENLIIYKFIRKHAKREYWPFSVFVYLFNSSFYLLGFSMMRQWLAMCLILFAYDYILKKKIIISFIIIYIASIIHHTASILFPIIFIAYVPMKYAKYYGVGFFFVFAILMLEGDALNSSLTIIMNQSETIKDYITNYDGYGANKSFGIGFILNMIPFLLSIAYLIKSEDNKNKILVLLACIGTMIIPFSQSLAMVKRMSLYFAIFSLISTPIVYSFVVEKRIRYLLIVLFIFMQVWGYWGFLNDPSYKSHYEEFKTIFSQL